MFIHLFFHLTNVLIMGLALYQKLGLQVGARSQGTHDVAEQEGEPCVISISTAMCTRLAIEATIPVMRMMLQGWEAAVVSEIGGRGKEKQS